MGRLAQTLGVAGKVEMLPKEGNTEQSNSNDRQDLFCINSSGKTMNNSIKLAFATSVGILIGAFGIEVTRAQSKPPAYVVAEFEVTDPAGWKTYVDGARANPSGTFIVRAAKGTSLAGSVPKTITIVKFNTLEEAIAFDTSASYTALKPMRDKSSNWRSYVVEGLQN